MGKFKGFKIVILLLLPNLTFYINVSSTDVIDRRINYVTIRLTDLMWHFFLQCTQRNRVSLESSITIMMYAKVDRTAGLQYSYLGGPGQDRTSFSLGIWRITKKRLNLRWCSVHMGNMIIQTQILVESWYLVESGDACSIFRLQYGIVGSFIF